MAGVLSVGVLEGSSEIGLTEEEYEKLSKEEKFILCAKVERIYREAGADYVIRNLAELPELITRLS